MFTPRETVAEHFDLEAEDKLDAAEGDGAAQDAPEGCAASGGEEEEAFCPAWMCKGIAPGADIELPPSDSESEVAVTGPCPAVFVFGATVPQPSSDFESGAAELSSTIGTKRATRPNFAVRLAARLENAKSAFSGHFTEQSTANLTGFKNLQEWEESMRGACELQNRLDGRLQRVRGGRYRPSFYSSSSESYCGPESDEEDAHQYSPPSNLLDEDSDLSGRGIGD